jgi:nucleoside-diphosphate-sugar epimerase
VRVARVLIVGGAGYVGGWLTDQAIEAGHDVIVYDLLLYEDVYLKPVEFVFGDILDRERLGPLVRDADVVVWLAALVGDGACALDPELTQKINVESVKWLTTVSEGRLVFMSTCSVYGAQAGELTEDSPVNPLSIYAQTKLEAEAALTDKNALIFRLGTLHGVGDEFSRLRVDLVVNTLTIRAALNGRMSVYGGQQYRPLLHVRDVGRIVVESMTTERRGIYNLGAENATVLEVAEAVRARIPDAGIEVTEMKFQDNRDYRVSSQKAIDELGFAPSLRMGDGIVQVQRLIDEGRIRDLTSPRFSNYESLRPYLRQEASPLGREVYVAHELAPHREVA